MVSKQYQFRCPKDLDLESVWDKKLNTTDNLVRILRAGITYLSAKKK